MEEPGIRVFFHQAVDLLLGRFEAANGGKGHILLDGHLGVVVNVDLVGGRDCEGVSNSLHTVKGPEFNVHCARLGPANLHETVVTFKTEMFLIYLKLRDKQ